MLAAKDNNGNAITIDDKHVDALRAALRGTLVVPGSPAYDESRALWNAMIDRRPALVARCLGTPDVIACVNFARTHGIALSMKGGGHNIAGLACCDGGLMLDFCAMRGAWVDATERVAHAQPGCLLGDLDRETQLHGLAAPLGFVSATGVTGLTLGGGFGYLSRQYGWTSDAVRSMTLVTAEGKIARASEHENPDLFWGLRGGGGNFGVITDIEYELFPVGPEVVGGLVAWHAAEAPRVLEMFQRMANDAPRELTLVTLLRKAPPAPWIERDAHGKPIVAVVACHAGDVAAGERLLAPLKAFAKPVGDIMQRRSYVSQQSLLDATQPKGRRYYWKSEYVRAIDGDLLAGLARNGARIESPHSAAIVFQLGGAIARHGDDHSAVGNRDAAAVFNLTSSWENAADDGGNIAWARGAWEDMKRFSTGGTYVNFLNEDDADDRVRAAYGENLQRLANIKRAWDPENLFRMNKNIAPAR